MLILDDYSKGQRLLKELFIKIQTNHKNYSKEELIEIEKFLKDEIIVKNTDDTFELNSKYKVALVKVGKNLVVLEDLISEHKNIKIEFDDLNGAYDGDLVLAKRVFNPRSRTKAKIVKILDGKKNEVLVYIKDKAFYTIKENIKLENKNALKYQDGDVLLVENKSLELIKNLGNIENPKIDELISLHLYNETFRLEKHLEVTANMDDPKQRVDLRDLYFCTIDPNSAKDHDDAIYFDTKENILYVAIADVSYFVKEGSELDLLAFKKSTSVYLPTKVLPMLPPILSEEMCSLKEGVDRYSYVFKLHLDLENLSVKKAELFEAIIKEFNIPVSILMFEDLISNSYITQIDDEYFSLHNLMKTSIKDSVQDILKRKINTFLFNYYENNVLEQMNYIFEIKSLTEVYQFIKEKLRILSNDIF